MKKLKILLVILLAFFIIPFSVFAEDEEVTEEVTTTEASKEVTLYFFRGEGCSHCAEFEEWLDEIEEEYGAFFEVKDYETWYNEDNAALMTKVATLRNEEDSATGVPYIIIGNKSWIGFADEYKEEILSEIKSLYDQDPAKRYDIMKLLPDDEKEDSDSNGSSIAALIITLLAGGLVVFGVVKARESTK